MPGDPQKKGDSVPVLTLQPLHPRPFHRKTLCKTSPVLIQLLKKISSSGVAM